MVIIDDNLNEFVWVPVKDLEPDGTRDGTFTDNQQFGRRTFGSSDSLGGKDPVAGKCTEYAHLLLTNIVKHSILLID